MKDKQKEFEIEVSLCFTELVKAKSVEEAIKKLEDKYINSKGRLPREYIGIDEYNEDCFYQVGD